MIFVAHQPSASSSEPSKIKRDGKEGLSKFANNSPSLTGSFNKGGIPLAIPDSVLPRLLPVLFLPSFSLLCFPLLLQHSRPDFRQYESDFLILPDFLFHRVIVPPRRGQAGFELFRLFHFVDFSKVLRVPSFQQPCSRPPIFSARPLHTSKEPVHSHRLSTL